MIRPIQWRPLRWAIGTSFAGLLAVGTAVYFSAASEIAGGACGLAAEPGECDEMHLTRWFARLAMFVGAAGLIALWWGGVQHRRRLRP